MRDVQHRCETGENVSSSIQASRSVRTLTDFTPRVTTACEAPKRLGHVTGRVSPTR